MKVVRKLALLAGAVVVLAAPAAAQADALKSAGVAVGAGYVVTAGTGLVQSTGAYPASVVCTSSMMTYQVVTNNVRGVTVRSDLTSWTFGGCNEQTRPVTTACTVTMSATPWANQVEMDARSDEAGFSFSNNKLMTMNCGGLVCQYQGTGTVPMLSLDGAWTDAAGGNPARIDFMSPNMRLMGGGGGCGARTSFTATYDTTATNLTLTL